jgi:hypothetical protein
MLCGRWIRLLVNWRCPAQWTAWVRAPGGIRTRDLRPYDWGALSAELQGRSPAGESNLPGRLLRSVLRCGPIGHGLVWTRAF